MGTDGAEAIRGQQAYVERKTKGVIRFMPPNAEPGPVVLLENDRVQVIALDTQWWLHEGGKPYYPGSAFAQEAAGADPEEITMGLIADSLAGLLRGYDGPLTIILGHHPLETHGPHGGFFTWKDHIFPLTNIEAWLWLPLPIVGSVYPLARLAGFSEQDMSNSRYAKFIEMIDEAIRVNRPVVYASGHEHALQVLRPSADRLYLVSGNGILDHSSAVTGGEHTLFASELPGYMRLDFFMASGDSSASAADSASPSDSSSAPPGGVLLSVVGTPGTGKPVELYRYWVVPPGDRSRDTLR
jgi:hypothetical protein